MTLFARGVARALEQGRLDSPPARALAELVGSVTGRAHGRRLSLPADTRVIGVGGATLGGSWKTPCAIALAAALAARGVRVCFVGHGHRGAVGRPRLVRADDAVADVGDEALVAARSLLPGVQVVVGGELDARLRFAASTASLLVVDGLTRGALSGAQHHVLALDDDEPWGWGACPPAGDLRAPARRLLAACDAVVAFADVRALPSRSVAPWPVATYDLLLPAIERDARSCLVTAMARPGRLMRALSRRGISPTLHELPDHGDPRAAAALARTLATRRDLDRVLATEKCARHLGPTFGGLPVVVIGLEIRLPDALVDEAARGRPRIRPS